MQTSSPLMLALLASACCLFLLQVSAAKSITSADMDLMEDDGTVENALLNYLYARQMVNRMRNNLDVSDLQRKRSYWKQCAFNAVSCFGKKK